MSERDELRDTAEVREAEYMSPMPNLRECASAQIESNQLISRPHAEVNNFMVPVPLQQ